MSFIAEESGLSAVVEFAAEFDPKPTFHRLKLRGADLRGAEKAVID
jgi:hypothetical protein